ncbi:MAG: DnaJ C-terminal domain-containing protein [Acidimicrobiales bacterium]|jgi:molecular chaperone DnaJ
MAIQREWFDKDYYAVLGVPSKSTAKEITKAYRKLARSTHPDSSTGDEEKFKKISAAYDVVGDEDRRKEYDEARRIGPAGAGFGGGGFASGPADGAGYDDLGDLGSMFGTMFGRRRGGAAGPIKGVDQEARLHLGFLEAVEGVTTSVHLTSEVLGPNGPERKSRQVNVRIPAGVDDGQRIRLRGKGGSGRNGGPPGDLYVIVEVAPHEMFGRKGRHLTLTVPVTFPEAALGAAVKVPTLDGSTVTVKVPAGTKSGTTFRVKGRGVETIKSTGDLLVTVEVVVPTSLTDQERAAIEALAEVTDWSPRGASVAEGGAGQ